MALPEVRKAIDGISYVCDHLRKEDQEKMVFFLYVLHITQLLKIKARKFQVQVQVQVQVKIINYFFRRMWSIK